MRVRVRSNSMRSFAMSASILRGSRRASASHDQRNFDGSSHLRVIALELAEIILVIVLGEERILRHQIHFGKALGMIAFDLQHLGLNVGLQALQFVTALERLLDGRLF